MKTPAKNDERVKRLIEAQRSAQWRLIDNATGFVLRAATAAEHAASIESSAAGNGGIIRAMDRDCYVA